jgi:8-oxo-dGTP pyrophosphatase MutT (NUDIX family)
VSDRALPDWLVPLRDGIRSMRAEDLSAFVPPEEPKPREGAVLVLFGEGPEGPDLLLTERAHTMRSQPGQVSFPGGSLDPGEDAVQGALREAHEETGVDPSGIDVLAVLPRLWLPPRNFAVAPVLGYWHHDSPVSVTNPREVHAVFRVPLAHLLEPENRFTIRHPMGWKGPAWMIGPRGDVLLWGFTAGVIHALFNFVGWTKEWDESDERGLPEHFVDWERIAKSLGIEVPDGERFDPVAAGLIPDPYDADEPPSAPVTGPEPDRDFRPGR